MNVKRDLTSTFVNRCYKSRNPTPRRLPYARREGQVAAFNPPGSFPKSALYRGGEKGSTIMEEWCLIHTKAGKEAAVVSQLNEWMPEAFLPTLKLRIHRWGRLVTSVCPLFPCYVFARLPAHCDVRRLNYTSGVREIVRAGEELLLVPISVIVQLKDRCSHGPIELPSEPFQQGEQVTIANGALKGLQAVFEQYLSGSQRVAILLSSLTETSIRVVLPSNSIIRGAV